MSLFRKGNDICFVDRQENECIDIFLDRGNFIISQKPSNNEEYKKTVLFSYIYANSKYLKCEYSLDIMKELEIMKNNMISH